MRRLMLALALLIFMSPAFSIDVDSLHDSLQKTMDRERLENNVAGMQMTIVLPSGDHVTLTSGTVENEAGADAVSPETLFQIGSGTKSFTAALLLKLEVAGKLKLSDPLSKYLPQFPQWGKVTLDQLLNSTSGIPNYYENKSFQKRLIAYPRTQWDSEELVDIAANMPTTFAPGQGWHYSNTNFILAGMVAEKITKKSLRDLYNEDFLADSPLSLSQTYYFPSTYPNSILRRMAHGYVTKRDGEKRDVVYDNMSWAGAAGAMVSNSQDLADWAYALFHNHVVPKSTVQKMMTAVSIKTGKASTKLMDGYGLGVGMHSSSSGKWWGQEGETSGYHTIFLWFPKSDLTIAVLSNGEASHLRDFAESLPGYINQ
jgi:D-alanyl-D-alanine carboxypeptidase